MNEYILRRAIQDLFGHVDAIPASDAIITALKRDGICGRARWLMESRPGWLVSTEAVRGRRASA